MHVNCCANIGVIVTWTYLILSEPLESYIMERIVPHSAGSVSCGYVACVVAVCVVFVCICVLCLSTGETAAVPFSVEVGSTFTCVYTTCTCVCVCEPGLSLETEAHVSSELAVWARHTCTCVQTLRHTHTHTMSCLRLSVTLSSCTSEGWVCFRRSNLLFCSPHCAVTPSFVLNLPWSRPNDIRKLHVHTCRWVCLVQCTYIC